DRIPASASPPGPHSSSPPLTDRSVNLRYLADVPTPLRVLHIEDVVRSPVEMEGDVRDLLVQRVGRVRHDSPRRPPARFTAKVCPHSGQTTPARVWPSLLTRRYMSCRNARSEANRFSITPAWTSVTVPIRVITRASSTTVRYAGCSRTRSSRSGTS